jgi:hypothetical protein
MESKNPSSLELLTILNILKGSAAHFQKKAANRINTDVNIKPLQTNQTGKRHFIRNRRPMTDCLSNCIRRVQRVIACKNLCF